MLRADEPQSLASDNASPGALLGSDVLAMLASAGARLKAVMALPCHPACDGLAAPAEPRPAGGPPVLPLPPLGRDGFLVAPGWGRRTPPPNR